MTITLCCDS